MAQLVLPRVQAMVLCDGVEESEHETGVFDLTGVRTVIESPFPAVVTQLCVFAQMSGHQGQAAFHIEIESVETGEIVAEGPIHTVAFETPALPVSVLFRLSDCVFPRSGVYYIQVYHEKRLIGERPLLLREEA